MPVNRAAPTGTEEPASTARPQRGLTPPGEQRRPSDDATAARERTRVTVRCAPMEPSEREVLLRALLQFSEGCAWPEIHCGLLKAHGSTRVHMILRLLLHAIFPGGLDGLVTTPGHELTLQFQTEDLRAVGQLARQLEALSTPFCISIRANDRDSGAVRASWGLGLDRASVTIVGDVSTDRGWRRRLLSQMEDLLAARPGPRLPETPSP